MGIAIQPKSEWVIKREKSIKEERKRKEEELLRKREEREEREKKEREERNKKSREKYRLKKIEEKKIEKEWEEGREEREREERNKKSREKYRLKKIEEALRIQVQAKKDKEYELENEYRINREKLDKKLSKEYKELISKDINTSSLDNLDLTYAERIEITEFGKLCSGTQLPELKRKFVKVTQYITDHNLWDRFPTIRAKLTFSGGSNHKGISTKYYRITMNFLGSETCNTGEHVISSKSF